MSGGRPPRVAAWLFRHLGCSPNNESILGDIHEQYMLGQSYLWYWKQVILGILAAAHAKSRTKERLTMKRAVVWSLILLVTFSLGFWTARSRWIVHEETTAEVIADMREQATLRRQASAYRKMLQENQTLAFFRWQVENAEAEAAREGTPESKRRLEDLRYKLDAAQKSKNETRR